MFSILICPVIEITCWANKFLLLGLMFEQFNWFFVSKNFLSLPYLHLWSVMAVFACGTRVVPFRSPRSIRSNTPRIARYIPSRRHVPSSSIHLSIHPACSPFAFSLLPSVVPLHPSPLLASPSRSTRYSLAETQRQWKPSFLGPSCSRALCFLFIWTCATPTRAITVRKQTYKTVRRDAEGRWDIKINIPGAAKSRLSRALLPHTPSPTPRAPRPCVLLISLRRQTTGAIPPFRGASLRPSIRAQGTPRYPTPGAALQNIQFERQVKTKWILQRAERIRFRFQISFQ